MLPTGFPAVIRDGVDALRWAAAALERALPRVPDWVAAEIAPSNEKAIAEARERAKRERVLHVIAFVTQTSGRTRSWISSEISSNLRIASNVGQGLSGQADGWQPISQDSISPFSSYTVLLRGCCSGLAKVRTKYADVRLNLLRWLSG